MQIFFKPLQPAHRHVGREHLVADPVQRVEPPEAFLGIYLRLLVVVGLLAGDRLVVEIFLIEQEFAGERGQIEQDVEAFLGEMGSAGLVSEVGASA